ENLLSKEIKKAKEKGDSFQLVNNVFEKPINISFNNSLFFNLDEVNLVAYNPSNLLSKKEKNVSIELPLGKKFGIIDLMEVPDSFCDFEVITEKGESYPCYNSKVKHYRGTIRGEENSLVAISFFEDDVMGMVANNEGNYNIGN